VAIVNTLSQLPPTPQPQGHLQVSNSSRTRVIDCTATRGVQPVESPRARNAVFIQQYSMPSRSMQQSQRPSRTAAHLHVTDVTCAIARMQGV